MSTEIERRLRVLEKKIVTGTPCSHPLPIVGSDEEAQKMIELLDACPRCCNPPLGAFRVVIIRLEQTKPARRDLGHGAKTSAFSF